MSRAAGYYLIRSSAQGQLEAECRIFAPPLDTYSFPNIVIAEHPPLSSLNFGL